MPYSSTLTIQATHSSKTAVNFYLTTLHHILEDGTVIFMVPNMSTSNLAKNKVAVLQ
jgi:hypothetical protein